MRKQTPGHSGRRAVLAVALAAGLAAFFLVPLAGSAQAAGSPVTDLGASTVYYDGALVSATLNGNGDFFDYGLVYGPTGGTTMTTWGFGTSSTGPAIPVSITLSQLTPGASYSYTWQTYDNFYNDPGTPPAGSVVFTWAQEQPFLGG